MSIKPKDLSKKSLDDKKGDGFLGFVHQAFIDNYLNLGFFIFTFIFPVLGFFYSLYRVYKSMK